MEIGSDKEQMVAERVIVVHHPDCQISTNDSLALLRSLEVELGSVATVSPNEIPPAPELSGTSVVIVLDDNVCDLPELEALARKCSDAGSNVIALFGPNYTYDGLHAIAKKFGTQCGWFTNDLASSILNIGEDQPSDSAGNKVHRPKVKEVNCS